MTRLAPSTAREILRLRLQLGVSLREVARCCDVGIATAHATLQRARATGITWPRAMRLDDAELVRQLYAPDAQGRGAGKPRPDFAEVARARHAGKPLLESWREYRASTPEQEGYSYSHFCQMLKSWQRRGAAATRHAEDGPGRRRQRALLSCGRHDDGLVVSRF